MTSQIVVTVIESFAWFIAFGFLNLPIFSSKSKKEDVKDTTSTSSRDDCGESGTTNEDSKGVSKHTDDNVNDDTIPKELDTNTQSSLEKQELKPIWIIYGMILS